MDMRFGMWIVRSLYRAGALGFVTSEIERCRMDLVVVQEVSNYKIPSLISGLTVTIFL
jgi:hypothetical protein